MTISQLARRARVGTETIRFYEREGLLVQPRKPPQGYRQYTEEYVSRVRFIKQCQAFGFTLNEARELLRMLERGEADCAPACDLARRKIGELERRIAEDKALLERLTALLDKPCRSQKTADCAVMETLRAS
ncbi:MAG: MerR family transcriptional regulator [Bryobacter sp.]|nr:MerR family transcriptional regulator [Bryobacter sp.]